jgi:glycosyltransferase involved in cell wall biosynthesis
LRREIPKTLVYLEALFSLTEAGGGAGRVHFRVRRDFPWIFEEPWVIERWGLRRAERHSARRQAGGTQGNAVRGPRFPFPVFPRVFLLPVMWVTHLLQGLLRPRAGIFVAYSPIVGVGAAVARLLRRRTPVLIVRIIEDPTAKDRLLYRKRVEPWVLERLGGFALRRADLVLPMGPFTHELATRAGVPEERIIELSHPTRWEGAEPPAGEADGPPRIVGAGRLIPEKGFDLLLLAFADLTDEFPDVRLELAGDGVQRPDLERLANDLELGDRVRFMGWIPGQGMGSFFSGARVAVLPSRMNEGLGMVLVEAGVAGCALVGTDVEGIRDIVHPGRTGILVPPNDFEVLAEALRSLLRDPDEARRLGAGAREEALAFVGRRDAALQEIRQRVEALRSTR